ncbi:MAG: ADOP family duplicated permease [Gemmatimonadota bacterium]
MKSPPRWAEALLGAVLPRDDRDEMLGDLAEAYARRAEHSAFKARAWYLGQLLFLPGWLILGALRAMRFDPGEFRRTLRGLARTPGFTIVAVVSLGLGIGATTAIYGAMRALIFVSLPVEEPEQLSLVYHTWPDNWNGRQSGSDSSIDPYDGERTSSNISWPAFTELRDASPEGVELSAYAFVRELSLVRGNEPAIAPAAMMVSGSYFQTLRLPPHSGRMLTPADDQLGAEPVAVVSHSFWQRAFGSDPGVIGQSVRLNGRPFRVVGVMKRGYVGLSPGGFFGASDLVVPMAHAATFVDFPVRDGEDVLTSRLNHWVRLVARVDDRLDWRGDVGAGWTELLSAHMVEAGVVADGDRGDVTVRMLEGRRGLDELRRETEEPLQILGFTVALVLLIACANLTTLLLARGVARTEELALRRALGASRWELARPQLVESLLLGVVGGTLGFFVALEGGPLLVSSLTGGEGSAAVRYDVSWPLIASATIAALVAAGLTGWAPAARMMRTEPNDHLGVRDKGASRKNMRLGRALIAIQIAISVPLVVGAGLFLQTLGNIVSIDPGFRPEGIVAFRVDASLVTKDDAEQQVIYQRILDEVHEIPGVASASIVGNVLVSGWRSNSWVDIDGETPMMDFNAVSPAFLETMGISLRSGRFIEASDDPDAPHVVVVNETAERELFGGSAIGRTFSVGGRRPVEIVGVVADTKYYDLREEINPSFYDSWTQRPDGLYATHYVMRSTQPVATLEREVRDIVSGIDRGLPLSAFRTQSDDVIAQALRERVFARLLTAFGLFGLLLSCIGLYGLMSFNVSQRMSEMGVRLALGAAPESIVGLVLKQVAGLALLGLIIGVVASLQVGPLIEAMLFGVESNDGVTIVAATLLMFGVALLAGGIPARRASKVDPMVSLQP